MIDFVKAKTNCYISYSHGKKLYEEKERMSNIADGNIILCKMKELHVLSPVCLSAPFV